MGHRCYSSLTCAKRDQEHFEALGYVLQDEQAEALIDGELAVVPGAAYMVDEQANYGHTDELRELAEKERIPFLVENGSGDAYGDYLAASDGKTFAEHECLHDSAYPAVRVPPSGAIESQDLASARAYWEVYQAARQAITGRAKEARPCKKN